MGCSCFSLCGTCVEFIPVHLVIRGRLSSRPRDSRLRVGGERISRCQHQHSKSIKRHGRGEERGLGTRLLCLRDRSGLSVGGSGEVRQSFPSYVPKYQHSPGEGGTIGCYNTNSTRIAKGCEVWLSRARRPGSFVFWPCSSIKLQLISLPSASEGSRELQAVFSFSIPCAPNEGDCRDWKRVYFRLCKGGGVISLL